MKLGIMQPYFFPYLGYFDLINRVDRWIVFDTPQYIRHGWINRNRILHPAKGWQYIIVPLAKHSRDTAIKEVQILPHTDWRSRILGQIMHYKKRAPGFSRTYALIEECLDAGELSLSRLNTRILARICVHLEIPFNCTLFSEMGLSLGPIDGPGDWALKICQCLRADEYLNPPGGEGLFDPAKFSAAGINLLIQDPFTFLYDCPGYCFEPNLSVIDALMWNEPDRIKAHLDGRRKSMPVI